MKKQLSVLLSVVSIIFLLFLLVAVNLIIFINPNDFKPKLSTWVRKHTGYQLSFNGDIQWSFFPWFNLSLPEMIISNPHYFSEQPLAKSDKITLYIKLLPLLREQIEITKIRLYGVSAHSLNITLLTISELKTDLLNKTQTMPSQTQISGSLSSPLLHLALLTTEEGYVSLAQDSLNGTTQFNSLNTRFTLYNKMLSLQDLHIKNGDLYLAGKGSLDLHSQQLHYQLEDHSKNIIYNQSSQTNKQPNVTDS